MPSHPGLAKCEFASSGRLPHWETDAGLYFVTFHLADSLPRRALDGIVERNRILVAAKRAGAHLLPNQKRLVAEFSPKKIEEYPIEEQVQAP